MLVLRRSSTATQLTLFESSKNQEQARLEKTLYSALHSYSEAEQQLKTTRSLLKIPYSLN